MGLTALHAVMDDLFRYFDAEKHLRACVTRQEWIRAVGPQLARHAEVAYRRGDTLYITVSGPVWMQQLSLLHADIIARLNSGRQTAPVRAIRLRVGVPTGAQVVGREPPLAPLDAQALDRCRQAINDPQLRHRFGSLLEARRGAFDRQREELE